MKEFKVIIIFINGSSMNLNIHSNLPLYKLKSFLMNLFNDILDVRI